MTRETKVGLIVGLAFITVFAVILSHKGTQPRPTPASAIGAITDASNPTNKAAASNSGSRSPGRSGVPSPTGGDPTHAAAARTSTPPSQAGNLDITPLPPVPSNAPIVPLPDLPVTADASHATREPLTKELDTWLGKVQNAVETTTDAAANLVRKAPPSATKAPAGEMNAPSGGTPSATDGPGPDAPGTPAPEIKPAIKQEYVAQKGDTLTRIASKVYGSSSKRAIDTIVAANPKEIPNRNSVRVGAKLIIPELPPEKFENVDFPPRSRAAQPARPEDLVARNAPAPAEAGDDRAAKLPAKSVESMAKKADATKGEAAVRSSGELAAAGMPDAKKPDAIRYHTVKERETLGDIAQKYLGSSTRWKEIYKLNEGKYPDPSRIRAGAQIKLPANGNATRQAPAHETDRGG